MRHLYAALLFSALAVPASAQECSGGRYSSMIFTDTTVTYGVVYGSNTAVAGGTVPLRLDVYEPTGDVLEARPVVIVAFGGSFIGGTPAQVASYCTMFAKMGYVAIAPEYRVGFFWPTEANTTRAVMRGAHDMKAVVRYLRRSVAELDNPYRIDQERIISGGVSAGAISAIHAVYLDQEAEIPAILLPEMPALGGIEGNSGSPGYSSEVMAVYSFSGAIGDSSWIQAGDPPLVSLHEVGDGVVPYYTQEVSVSGIPTGLVASGSHDIHERADHIGLTNCLLSYPGNGHTNYLATDVENAMNYVALFCSELICGQPVSCGNTLTAVGQAAMPASFTVQPNPASDFINFTIGAPARISLFDVSGREVMQLMASAGTVRMDISSLPDGVYMLRSQDATEQWTRIVKAN